MTTTYTYDAKNLRLARLRTQDAGLKPLQDFLYTYDKLGNILTITDKVHTGTQAFKYDALNRLVKAAGFYCGTQAPCTKTYRYDEIGNILEKDGVRYFYGETGGCPRLNGQTCPHAVTSLKNGSTVAESFLYDQNGNMVERNKGGLVTNYIYDVENRLVEVKLRGVTIAQYEYDGDGGRTKKTDFRHVNKGWYGCLF